MSIEQLIEEKHLTPLERAFAQEMGVGGDRALFLAYLIACLRLGHLCVEVTDAGVSPSLPWTASYVAELIRGAHSLPPELCQPADPEALVPVVRDGSHFALQRNFRLERQIAGDVARLLAAPSKPLNLSWDKEGLLPEQRRAVQQALEAPLSIITGGPGTGKTYIARRILETIGNQRRTAVVAPTGRAARNLGGQTIHRLLGLPAPSDGSSLSVDYLLIDEASMIDAHLMAQLLCRVRTGTRLVMMGDHHQLPPVESGAPFAELLKVVPAMTLDQCVRVETPALATFANAIREGNLEQALDCGAVQLEPLEQIPALCEGRQLLSPFRQGPYGCDAVNAHLHAQQRGMRVPILITANDVGLDLYNGDTAILVRAPAVDPYAELPDGRRLSMWELPAYALGYCISVHKAQGSEFDEVCLLFPEGSEIFGREILYTAVTRARRSLKIFGKEETVRAALAHSGRRLSGLARHLSRLSVVDS